MLDDLGSEKVRFLLLLVLVFFYFAFSITTTHFSPLFSIFTFITSDGRVEGADTISRSSSSSLSAWPARGMGWVECEGCSGVLYNFIQSALLNHFSVPIYFQICWSRRLLGDSELPAKYSILCLHHFMCSIQTLLLNLLRLLHFLSAGLPELLQLIITRTITNNQTLGTSITPSGETSKLRNVRKDV